MKIFTKDVLPGHVLPDGRTVVDCTIYRETGMVSMLLDDRARRYVHGGQRIELQDVAVVPDTVPAAWSV